MHAEQQTLTAAHSIYIGRQPILDRALDTVGYELLFRRSPDAEEAGAIVDGDAATAYVLVNAVTEFGLDQLVGDKLAFFNLTARYLVEDSLVSFLPPDRVVLEVLEDVRPTRAVIDGISRLVDRGYTIALDDFDDFDDSHTPVAADAPEDVDPAEVVGREAGRRCPDRVGRGTSTLLPFAKVVKYELDVASPERLRRLIADDHAAGRTVVLERIETPADAQLALDLGADHLQGFFFAKPRTERASAVVPDSLGAMRLLAQVNDPQASFTTIIEVLSQDVGMSVKVLRYVNSAGAGLHGHVRSVQQAAVLVGLDVLRAWANLALMTSVIDRPFELFTLALTRARFCEEVARRRNLPDPSEYYTAGLLSLLDVMSGAEMETIVRELALEDELSGALLGEPGPLTDVLALAIELEQDTTDDLDDLDVEDLVAYQEALSWATRLLRTGEAA